MPISDEEYMDLQDTDKALKEFSEELEKMFAVNFDNLSQRMSEVHNKTANITTTINALMQIVKEQQGLFRRAMLWITSAFAAMHYDGTAEGLRLILGDPKEGAKTDEDSKSDT